MKKLYASLALVAAGAIAATAANTLVQQNFTEVQSLRGAKLYEYAKHVPQSAVEDLTQKMDKRYSAKRAAKAFEGSYLTTGIGGFDGYEANGTFTVTEELYLDGFQGFSYDVNYVEAIKFDHPVQATLAENGDVVIALGQAVGTYNGVDIVFFSVDADDKIVITGEVTYVANEDGSYTANVPGVGVGFLNPASGGYSCFSLEYDSKILAPNGTATYHWIAGTGTDFGNFEVPMFIGFEDEEYEGVTYTTMYMSALLYELTGDGYPASYEVEEAENGYEAIANSPICVYNEEDDITEGGNITYAQLASTIKTYTSDVIWNVSADRDAVELSVQQITSKEGKTADTDCLYIHNSKYSFGQLLDLTLNLGDAGVQEIIADAAAENGPVEYYNLQGMKINNPAAGQIVIRRQGNKSAKMIVR